MISNKIGNTTIAFLFALLVGTVFLTDAVSAAVTVGKYKTHELVFTADSSPGNPFDTYLLKLEITDPNGKRFTIDGFFDGDGKGGRVGKVWKARITPYRTGIWKWRTVRGDAFDSALQGLSGQFTCVESGDVGGVIRSGKYFRFQDGGPVFLQGHFLDFLGNLNTTHVYMSEKLSDAQRNAIISRHANFHTANKVNVYFANVGDYNSLSVTPWMGSATNSDKSKMDLARWKRYDNYIRRMKDNRMIAEMWFFADDSNFGRLSQTVKNRLFRYGMARTSAFSHTMYVIALEWQEGWTQSAVTNSGNYIQAHNPWGRLLSVHSKSMQTWKFGSQSWANFFASQSNFGCVPNSANAWSVQNRINVSIPHLHEEFTHTKFCTAKERRNKTWANFAGGSAGGGNGSDQLKPLMRFLSQSRIPFQRMSAKNSLVSGGGSTRYALAEVAHHYFVYSQGGTFTLDVTGQGLSGRWFDPRNPNANLGNAFNVSPGRQTFTPPNNVNSDWVLWISDGKNLTSGKMYVSKGATLTQEVVSSLPGPVDTTAPARPSGVQVQ